VTSLEVKGLTKRFAGLVAVDGVTFGVEKGSITALIGPNGAGKTTCFNMIAGTTHPSAGQVMFDGQDITGQRPEDLCRIGIARTFQIVRPLTGMSVVDNVVVGALMRTASVTNARKEALALLERVGLRAKADHLASSLTLPDRKMLELAKALSTRPRLLLLDEVMAGLRPTEGDKIAEVLRSLNRDGLTILLIEHVMRIVMNIAHHVVVLHHGAKIADGVPAQVVTEPIVLDSYLGRRARPA
jgi:branched-chain amino acid transport system ATP-binding protein